MNTKSDIKTRKYRNNIEVSGRATMILGAWFVAKFILSILLGAESLTKLFGFTGLEPVLYWNLCIALLVVLITLIFLLYIYIGRSAVKYARGQKKNRFFLIITAIFAIMNIWGIPWYFTMDYYKELSLSTRVASAFVDISSVFISFDMIFSAYALSKLKGRDEYEAESCYPYRKT
ncbi:MAG: hypothetical protein K6G22_09140 [Lachnospiraceae bacterium]|nr:hypothetical protein [Lachnospiraceae bacterium]